MPITPLLNICKISVGISVRLETISCVWIGGHRPWDQNSSKCVRWTIHRHEAACQHPQYLMVNMILGVVPADGSQRCPR